MPEVKTYTIQLFLCLHKHFAGKGTGQQHEGWCLAIALGPCTMQAAQGADSLQHNQMSVDHDNVAAQWAFDPHAECWHFRQVPRTACHVPYAANQTL